VTGTRQVECFSLLIAHVGVGYPMKQPQFLRARDKVEVYIQTGGILKYGISHEYHSSIRSS